MRKSEKIIGLKRGTVFLCHHLNEWNDEAQNTIKEIKSILGDIALDIQHIGSTAINSIMAKPIIDIAVKVKTFEDVLKKQQELLAHGYYYRKDDNSKNQLLFACGSYYDDTGEMQTHFIHVVLANSMEWRNYINFRDYMNAFPEKAKEYEKLKASLAEKCHMDEGREHYLKGKQDFILYYLRKALVWSFLGKTVTAEIDRPLGYVHKKDTYSLTYPINYGYIPGVIGGDGEELDVYILGVNEPVKEFTGKVIGIAHRENDNEDKLIAAPQNMNFTKLQIEKAVMFQEQYYKTTIETL